MHASKRLNIGTRNQSFRARLGLETRRSDRSSSHNDTIFLRSLMANGTAKMRRIRRSMPLAIRTDYLSAASWQMRGAAENSYKRDASALRK